MHSAVATNLENLKLLKYMTQTDSNGIERQLTLATWNGRLVLIDDSMPTEEVAAVEESGTKGESGYVAAQEAYTKYTTYVLGDGLLTMKISAQRCHMKCIVIQKHMVEKILCI